VRKSNVTSGRGASSQGHENLTVMALTIDAGRIVAIDVIRDPDKLTAVAD
jgi:hypothetical protein